MDKKTILTALLALAAGATIGYLAAPDAAKEAPAHSAADTPKHKENAYAKDAQPDVAALRRRIKELERRLADTAASAIALTNGATAEAVPPRRNGFGFGMHDPAEWRARIEEMKVKEPERYAQMTNRMVQWRSRSIANTQDKLDFFASLDTSAMTPRQRENHEKLQNLLVRREELMQSMDINNADISDADREKAFREMHELRGQIHSLENAERDMLLNQAARNLGCRGSEARELVDTIKTIYQATQSWGGGRRGPGPGRGGPR